ncbi:hypothetical protein EGW08_001221 [Elysia chlorotica]|uniref:Peptidase S54 rhomboid domain-containing protein n=1 Tax=Elysia chlorotica TaxID=188477 RepID=A0A433UB11_ELYCH|nr:hypothetical protein EGW08_001221 [Elysia chlorotica]
MEIGSKEQVNNAMSGDTNRDSAEPESRTSKISKKARQSIAEFFGVSEADERNAIRWEKRRVRMAQAIGKGLKEDTVSPPGDLTDGMRPIKDPLRKPTRFSIGTRQINRQSSQFSVATSLGGEFRKKSVFQMTVKGLQSLSSLRRDVRSKKSIQGQSFAPGSVSQVPEDSKSTDDAFSLVDDVFFDENLASRDARAHRELSGGPSAPGWRRRPPQPLPSTPGPDTVDGIDFGLSAPGWRRRPPQPLPSTPGPDTVDGIDFGLSKIKDKVVQSAMNRDKRQLGVGKFGKFARFSMKSSIVTKDVKQQLDDLDDHRPYFSYWVTFVQIVIFIVSVAVYGIAPIGIGTTKVSANVKMPNLAIQTETYVERDNLWIGPRQADLIHLGAKYSPCMRVDENLNRALEYDRKEESETACCIRNDGSGCVQTVEGGCSPILSSWEKWTVDAPGEGNRTSGTVCGQDPRFCSNPSSTPPFEWPDRITDWPICKETAKHNQSAASRKDRHMQCDILGRPCCFGIQGECIITTPEHCNLKRGFFHSEASLCSQVNCFEEICGMIPFADSSHPDQFYRLWTSLFLHGGLVHLIISILFQMFIMRDLEKLMGAIRTCIIYIGSGVAGNLASCTFIPYQVEVGPTGAQFGIAACMVVEVIQSYQMYRRPWRPVLITLGPLLIFFLLGLLPWFDNWAHIFGFLFGFMLAFAVMPYVTFGQFDKHRKLISIIVSLGLAIGLFTILVLVFYVAPLTECNWCIYLNCIPLTADFCENMAVDLNKNSSYSTYI